MLTEKVCHRHFCFIFILLFIFLFVGGDPAGGACHPVCGSGYDVCICLKCKVGKD